MKRYKALTEATPDYTAKYKDLASDPASQSIKGIVMWIRGWPPLDRLKNPELNPQHRIVRTLKAGK